MNEPEVYNRKHVQKRLIIALDMPDATAAYDFAVGLGLPHVVFKVGLELLFAGGADLITALSRKGFAVFADAKLLDIPTTVERATAQIARLGATYLTVHAHDEPTLQAARRGAQGSSLKLLGVTVLTSLAQAALQAQGIEKTVEELALLRARFAKQAGLYGVVASPHELGSLKAQFGEALAIITPGIRLTSALKVNGDDQARTTSPCLAITKGASAIVVGRPILQAAEPQAAARAILTEIAMALS